MLQLRTLRLSKTSFENLATGVMIQEEGVPLSFVKENGETKVQPAVAGAKFAGVAIAKNMPPASVPMVEQGVISANGSGALTRAPIAGQVLVKIDGVVADVVTGAPGAGEVALVGASYQCNVADAAKQISFQYMYAPTVEEARTILGDLPYGGLAANALDSVCTIKQGEFGTSFFDASADWTDVLFAKIGSGNKFVPAGANDGLAGVTVKNSPNAANPFLVLDITIG